MLNALDTTKTCGPDGITGKMLKMTVSSITPVLSKQFNLSTVCAFLLPGKLPQLSLSSSVVITDPSNYPPISLLPANRVCKLGARLFCKFIQS